MNRAWLAAQLESGRSIEAIAAEVGRHPSTVAYWMDKHGLVSRFAEKHAPKRPVTREEVQTLVDEGLTLQQLGERLGVGSAAVRHWFGSSACGRYAHAQSRSARTAPERFSGAAAITASPCSSSAPAATGTAASAVVRSRCRRGGAG
jgi:transposase-like protein